MSGLRARIHASSARLVLLGAFASTSLLNYGFGLVVGRLLAPGDFGLVAFGQTVLVICGLVLETGIPWSLSRDLAREPETKHPALIRGALLANCGLSLLLALAIFALYALGPLRGGMEQPLIVLLVCLALPLIAVATVGRGIGQGLERFGMVASIQTCEVAGKSAIGVCLVLGGLGAAGSLAGFVAGGILASGLSLLLVRRHLWTGATGRSVRWPRAGQSGPIFCGLLAFALLLNLDLLAVKLFEPGDRALAGYYQVAIMLANLPCYLLSAAVIPMLFAPLARADNLRATLSTVWTGMRIVILLVLPLELVLVLAPGLVVELLFPAAYAPAGALLQTVAIARTALLGVALVSATFQATGRAAVSATVLLAIAGLEALALAIGVPIWGGRGAAGIAVVAHAFALLILGSIYVYLVREHARVPWMLSPRRAG